MASSNTLLEDLKKSFRFFKTHPLLSASATPPDPALPQPTDFLSQLQLQILGFSNQKGIADFFTNPRLDDPAYITTLVILLAAVFTTMSWFSRSGSSGGWGGRFSPFGRPGAAPNNGEVSDADFSYITSEDLAAHGARKNRSNSRPAAPEIVDWEDKNPERDTDVLLFKNGRTNYPAHFPAQSVQDGTLKIGTVRQTAAKRMGVSDSRRIRMFYKGKNLKHDDRTAREEGLRGDGNGSEIMCVIGEANSGGMAPGSEDTAGQMAWSDGDDDDDTENGEDSGANTGGKKKSRKRGGKKNRRRPAPDAHNPHVYSNTAAAGPEYLPLPSHALPTQRPTSASASKTATPQTPLGKLDALASKFHTEFVPLAVQFMASPPEASPKRQMEYKKLSESILTQILMKLDGVETDGDQEARMRRKELVKEVQGMLNKLDDSVK